MEKLVLLSSIALVLTACSDDADKQRQLQAQQYVQQQYAQQPYAQPPVMQPQVVQAPAAPVIVQQQHDNTLTNMALGAVIGHTIANMGSGNDSRSTERVVEHKTVIIDNRPTDTSQNLAPRQQPHPVEPIQPNSNAMDMNKLSNSSKQTFNPGTPVSTTSKPSGMDMSRLSSKPTVSLAKPSSSMNMSKLGRK
jgi:hypothetical protein